MEMQGNKSMHVHGSAGRCVLEDARAKRWRYGASKAQTAWDKRRLSRIIHEASREGRLLSDSHPWSPQQGSDTQMAARLDGRRAQNSVRGAWQ